LKEELSSEKMAEETKEAIDVDQGLTTNDSNEDKMSLISMFNELRIPFHTSVYDEGSKRVVRVMDRSMFVGNTCIPFQDIIVNSDEDADLENGVIRPKNESVQAPEELERRNSKEKTSFIQMGTPFMIPIVQTLSHSITQEVLMCNNCNERLVAKLTLCYADWCAECDEALWSTRVAHLTVSRSEIDGYLLNKEKPELAMQ